jgi:hypothetical protein
MSQLTVEEANTTLKALGAQFCVVVPDGDSVTADEIWRLAGESYAIIPRDPHEEANDGDLVVARFGDTHQRTYDQEQLLARLRGNYGGE